LTGHVRGRTPSDYVPGVIFGARGDDRIYPAVDHPQFHAGGRRRGDEDLDTSPLYIRTKNNGREGEAGADGEGRGVSEAGSGVVGFRNRQVFINVVPIMLLTGAALFEAIQQTIKGSRALCAVAFWGIGADQLLLGPPDRDLRVICNLAMGGTNPHVISRLLEAGIEVRQCDVLHAKVYIGTDDAVITSANASMNGLGLGDEAGWIETGWIIPAKAAVPWFEALWDQSADIEVPADINAALVRFIREAKINQDNVPLAVATSDGAQDSLSEVYRGISVREAISLVLSVHQHPMTVPEIAAELKAGGLQTAAERLTDSVSNAIGRGILGGHFGRAGHARWGLLEPI
jgi:hypothetical protein